MRMLIHDNFPKIVCLCGSTKFWKTFEEANFLETMKGNIVLTIGCNTKSDDELFADLSPEDLEKKKAALDQLHLKKIDLADEVLILNVGGYIGQSTRNELIYAWAHGKAIRFWEGKISTDVLFTSIG